MLTNLEGRLQTLWACNEPVIVTHGTPMYNDSQVVDVPAYENVCKLQKQQGILK